MFPSDSDRAQCSVIVRRLIAGEEAVAADIVAQAPASVDSALLVAAAVVAGEPAFLDRARTCARAARDRQLIALADVHLRGDGDLFDVLVREHLADHPDHMLAAWIATQHS